MIGFQELAMREEEKNRNKQVRSAFYLFSSLHDL